MDTDASGQEVRDRAEEVYTRFAGTVEQRNTGILLKAWALNGEMDVCMAGEDIPNGIGR